MKKAIKYTPSQQIAIVSLRMLIGWHLLYEGMAKLLIPGWSSAGYLHESKWILSGFANWIILHSGILSAVDFINTWVLIVLGTALILGLFTRFAAISGAILLLTYYLNAPPLIGLQYVMPVEGHNLIVNKTLIEAVALITLSVFPSGLFAGLDILLFKFRNRFKWQQSYNEKGNRATIEVRS